MRIRGGVGLCLNSVSYHRSHLSTIVSFLRENDCRDVSKQYNRASMKVITFTCSRLCCARGSRGSLHGEGGLSPRGVPEWEPMPRLFSKHVKMSFRLHTNQIRDIYITTINRFANAGIYAHLNSFRTIKVQPPAPGYGSPPRLQA